MILPYGSDITAIVKRAEGATKAERREVAIGLMMEEFKMTEAEALEAFGYWLRGHREEDVVARPVLVAVRKRRAR